MRLRALIAVAASLLIPPAIAGAPDTVDVTPALIKRGAVIAGLSAVQFNGILLIRGKTNDPTRAAAVTRFASELGYTRVANLIVVVDDEVSDAAIEYTGNLRLDLEPELRGCRFHIESNRGVVRLTGRVVREDQWNLALEILGRIDGVTKVVRDAKRP